MLKIGKVKLENNVLLSPMEAVNCLAFRQVCKEYNAGLVATPMILVNRLFEEYDIQMNVVNFKKGEHPLQVQIAGADSEMIKKATLIVDEYADIIDINLGCPKNDICALKAGAFFSKHPEQLKKIIPAIMNNTNKPVTAKIRIGWDEKNLNTAQQVKILEDFGVAAITVHGRTRDQKGRGPVNLDEIRNAKLAAKNIPIIGNGDIKMPGHAKAMIERTGCDGVMIAAAAKGNPLILRRTVQLLETGKNAPEPSDEERAHSFLRFAHYYKDQPRQSFTEFRQHALWWSDYFQSHKILRTKIESAKEIPQITKVYEDEVKHSRR
jgi:tRNA-dihydrouridine synthase B